MQYHIKIDRKAAKTFAKLPKPIQKQVARKIETLKDTPFPEGYKKLRGEEELYRLRSGDYRIIYTFEKHIITVYVLSIGDRKDVYKSI